MRALRARLGAIFYDVPPFLWHLLRPGTERTRERPWVRIRNRHDRLLAEDGVPGVRCDWQWTSDLHVCKVFPAAGLALMRRAFRDWPIRLSDAPVVVGDPEVTFVLGHRGLERLPHLLMTLRSLAGQEGVAIEAIVVEQSAAPEIREAIPSWVRYIHTPIASPSVPYMRSWSLNVGARHARGRILVLHDNDMVMPRDYAREVVSRAGEGAEILDLKRFTFYLSAGHSQRILDAGRIVLDEPPEAVVQNLQGASIVATREAYEAIGGYDESFVGWGGEDNEMWERAATRRLSAHGYLPMLHLWHAPQREKAEGRAAEGLARQRSLSEIPVAERIERLRARAWGRIDSPEVGENHEWSG
ncbi:MAG TPA: galactosyltransferase-related protein [Thermoanaerobaculia bacterium]|nr:galactosyltransferase-related protein [Thermoanaerobaculia bacterium]